MVSFMLCGCQTNPTQEEPWFQNIQGSLPLNEAEKIERVRNVAAMLQDDASAMLPHDQGSRPVEIVFVTTSDGAQNQTVAMGRGPTLSEALAQSVESIQQRGGTGSNAKWIKVDFVTTSEKHPHVINFRQALALDCSLWGIAFGPNPRMALLPDELIHRALVDKTRHLDPDRIAAYLGQHTERGQKFATLMEKDALLAYRFRTDGFFTDGDKVVHLFRGHRQFPSLSEELLLQSARAGGEYLTRATREDGQFDYIYIAGKDKIPDDYNIIRHAGATYSMLELYELTKDKKLLDAARRALQYMRDRIKPVGFEGQKGTILPSGNAIALGANGLGVLAFAQYVRATGDKDLLPVARDLARWITSTQAENGHFTIHKAFLPSGKLAAFQSIYYPGEAILGLTRLYEVDRQKKWLDAAERGAHYQVKIKQHKPAEMLFHDHWVLYALYETYRRRSHSGLLSHSRRLASAMVRKQNRKPQVPDWLGSYYRPPRSTPTATRSEGLGAAFKLERDFGNAELARIFRNNIELGIRFQLQTQYTPECAIHLPDPAKAMGGFRRSLTRSEIRIDYVQHNLSSLIAYINILRHEQSR
ncbi:MAG: hypothetical protein KGZ25_09520 [Planctomycetes bacterium]|nr:hypothetical protein [Planctomycetota bacterium]